MKATLFRWLLSYTAVQAAPTYPLTIGSNDPFACSTEARAMDSNEVSSSTKLLVCGVTHSATQVSGKSLKICTKHPVPFVVSFIDSTLSGSHSFSSSVTYPKDLTQGVYTDAIACKMSERNTWTSESTLDHSLVVLKY